MNKKEAFLAMAGGENVGWMGYAFDAFPFPYPMVVDPITAVDGIFAGECVYDWWGVPWRHIESDPGAIPLINSENCIIKDITHWRDYVKFPSLDDLDFTAAKAQLAGMNRDEQIVMIPSYYGPFERAHTLMTFEDLLVALYEEPECVSELIGAIADWKIEGYKRIIDELEPDMIHCHDDWGDNSNLLFSTEIFRKYLKPHYKRMYGYIRSRGVLVQHHNDGYGPGLEKDLLDMGVSMWEGVIPQNDIDSIRKNTQGKLLLLGGIDQLTMDMPVCDEEAVRSAVRECIDKYAPGGAFLPCLPSVMGVNMQNMFVAVDEMRRYGEIWMEKNRKAEASNGK